MARTLRGLTLAEMVLALGVVLVLGIFLMRLLPSSGQAIARAGEDIVADNLAHSRLEVLRAQGFARLPLGVSPPATVELQRMVFTYTSEVAYVNDANPDLLKSVKVRVTWGDHHRTLESWIGNLGQ